ncbi:MAG TPA: hypothetical protein VFT87_03225 [Candidatus Saccharimonadales bacterium]|nr:hypothetical protein [Candidatus Saccharimonadales bacterium]
MASTAFGADFTKLKAAAVFSCDSDDPKGQVAAFQEAHRAVLRDLKEWRSTLKELVRILKINNETTNDDPIRQ